MAHGGEGWRAALGPMRRHVTPLIAPHDNPSAHARGTVRPRAPCVKLLQGPQWTYIVRCGGVPGTGAVVGVCAVVDPDVVRAVGPDEWRPARPGDRPARGRSRRRPGHPRSSIDSRRPIARSGRPKAVARAAGSRVRRPSHRPPGPGRRRPSRRRQRRPSRATPATAVPRDASGSRPPAGPPGTAGHVTRPPGCRVAEAVTSGPYGRPSVPPDGRRRLAYPSNRPRLAGWRWCPDDPARWCVSGLRLFSIASVD